MVRTRDLAQIGSSAEIHVVETRFGAGVGCDRPACDCAHFVCPSGFSARRSACHKSRSICIRAHKPELLPHNLPSLTAIWGVTDAFFGQDRVKNLPGHTQALGRILHGEPQRRKHILAQQLARVARFQIWVLWRSHAHFPPPSIPATARSRVRQS
jgi:hypothetical protein